MKEFDIDYDLINEGELRETEELIGSKLPSDYREHMLKFNGGTVPLGKEYIFDFKNNELFLEGFHQIKFGEGKLESYYSRKHSFLFPSLLPIGTIEGGFLALGYREGNYGKVYCYFSDKEPFEISSSFSNFINSLREVEVDI